MTGQLYSVDELLDQAVKGEVRAADLIVSTIMALVADVQAHRQVIKDAGATLPTLPSMEDVDVGVRFVRAEIYPLDLFGGVDPKAN